jgi:hypothetical protein
MLLVLILLLPLLCCLLLRLYSCLHLLGTALLLCTTSTTSGGTSNSTTARICITSRWACCYSCRDACSTFSGRMVDQALTNMYHQTLSLCTQDAHGVY